MKNNGYDVIIIGGGIVGLATGYYLSKQKQRVLLLEKDYLGAGSSGRCIGGIRGQFSTEATIKVAQESIRLFEGMENEFGFSVEWSPSGYLFLAYDEDRKQAFLDVMNLQQLLGLNVNFLSPDEIKKLFPYVNTDFSLGGTWCPTDGQADPFFVLKGYMLGMKKFGSTIKTGEDVVGIDAKNSDLFEITCKSGNKFNAPKIVNAAGPNAYNIGKMVGLKILAEPERHEALITEGVKYINIPMIVDYRPDGCYFQQRKTGQIIGCYTPEQRVSGKGTEVTFEFLTEMSRRMMRLIPSLENITVLRQWAGSYTMTPDGNPIVDETSVPGFYAAVAMCGHGFMLGPALGKYLSDFMIHKKWPHDMKEFSFNRNFNTKTEAMK